MTESGIIEESAYYESLHETPLIANTIARKKLFEMNRVISDTAEYGCYLFDHACKPLIADYVKNAPSNLVGRPFNDGSTGVDNKDLIAVNDAIRNHPVEDIGEFLRESMTAMIKIVFRDNTHVQNVSISIISSADITSINLAKQHNQLCFSL